MTAAARAAGILSPGVILACVLAGPAGGGLLRAQSAEEFAGRLSRMPVDRATSPSISGGGEVRATLAGGELTVSATFAGMSSPATAAHLHRAPVARRGPVAFTLDVPAAASGRIEATIDLSEAQVDVLRDGRYYLLIHTENNPGGELRGWLLPGRP